MNAKPRGKTKLIVRAVWAISTLFVLLCAASLVIRHVDIPGTTWDNNLDLRPLVRWELRARSRLAAILDPQNPNGPEVPPDLNPSASGQGALNPSASGQGALADQDSVVAEVSQ